MGVDGGRVIAVKTDVTSVDETIATTLEEPKTDVDMIVLVGGIVRLTHATTPKLTCYRVERKKCIP